MNIRESVSVLKMKLSQKFLPQMAELVAEAFAEGRPVHDVEQGLWEELTHAGVLRR